MPDWASSGDRATFDQPLNTGNSDPAARTANSGWSASTGTWAADWERIGAALSGPENGAADTASVAAGDMESCAAADMESSD